MRLILRGSDKQAQLTQVQSLPCLSLSPPSLADLELLATGAFSPLTGFMTRPDYERVLYDMRLANGLVWTLPITLPVKQETAASLTLDQQVALCENGRPLAILTVRDKYRYDKQREAELIYQTTDSAHPGVARLAQQGDWLLGGDIQLLDLPHSAKSDFPHLRHTPAQTRRMFARRGWKRIVGFQTRGPIDRAHEYMQKTALEIVDGLFIHPLIDEAHPDDLPADVRIASYQAILRDYYPADSVLLGVFPGHMRYAGPREAVFHALVRKNYGCTHYIVGQDYAGVGHYYGRHDAQRIFDQFSKEEIGVEILRFDNTFYCKRCAAFVSAKTCPHDEKDRLILSEPQIQELLARGEMLPPEFARPEVSHLLLNHVRRQQARHTK